MMVPLLQHRHISMRMENKYIRGLRKKSDKISIQERYKQAKKYGVKKTFDDIQRQVVEEDRSFEDALKILYRQEKNQKKFWLEDSSTFFSRFLRSRIAGIEQYYGGDKKKLSVKKIEKGPEFGGGDLWVKSGYGNMIKKALYEPLLPYKKKIQFLFETRVTKIEQDDQSVTIYCTSKSGEEKQLKAKRTIATFPLGVLKQNHITFSPPLTKRRRSSIERLGYGLLDKIILRWKEPWLNDFTDALMYCPKEYGAYRMWLNMRSYNNIEDAVLVGYVNPIFAKKMEKKEDDVIYKQVMEVLRSSFPDIPDPIDFKVTRWHQDPLSYGSYSYITTESDFEDFKILSKPFNRIHFAGEHTSLHYSTVHGAYMSGKRAANEVWKNEFHEI
mmetsp:Transcript_7406/g.10927  ORF Transcript_7406/g.10927 Transcript_7406/m.10927 type:complete len:385 (-) Transcript_7406:2633-3787(-)